MGFRFVGFLGFCFVGMTMLNRILEGALIAADEVGIMNTMAITRDQTVYGSYVVPVLNADFFFTGLKKLVEWDYSFFGGNSEIFLYLLYSVTFAMAFLLFMATIGMIAQFFAGRR